jgi:tetratricopeptide (TPR) repeat protein
MQGKPDEAIAWIEEATLSYPDLRQWHRAQAAIAHFVARRYTESVAAMEALGDLPPRAATWYAAALAQLGREDEAKKMIAEYYRNAPRFSLASRLRGFKHDEDREHYAEALRKAGLKGEPQ